MFKLKSLKSLNYSQTEQYPIQQQPISQQNYYKFPNANNNARTDSGILPLNSLNKQQQEQQQQGPAFSISIINCPHGNPLHFLCTNKQCLKNNTFTVCTQQCMSNHFEHPDQLISCEVFDESIVGLKKMQLQAEAVVGTWIREEINRLLYVRRGVCRVIDEGIQKLGQMLGKEREGCWYDHILEKVYEERLVRQQLQQQEQEQKQKQKQKQKKEQNQQKPDNQQLSEQSNQIPNNSFNKTLSKNKLSPTVYAAITQNLKTCLYSIQQYNKKTHTITYKTTQLEQQVHETIKTISNRLKTKIKELLNKKVQIVEVLSQDNDRERERESDLSWERDRGDRENGSARYGSGERYTWGYHGDCSVSGFGQFQEAQKMAKDKQREGQKYKLEGNLYKIKKLLASTPTYINRLKIYLNEEYIIPIIVQHLRVHSNLIYHSEYFSIISHRMTQSVNYIHLSYHRRNYKETYNQLMNSLQKIDWIKKVYLAVWDNYLLKEDKVQFMRGFRKEKLGYLSCFILEDKLRNKIYNI